MLSAMADTNSFEYITQKKNLSHIFDVMNSRAGTFVDLGVIDGNGLQRAYVGPYKLHGLNYYQQPWFDEVLSRGVFISDVYRGYRQSPHFIIAVHRQENDQAWILRATIEQSGFGDIIRAAHVGKTGDAFIINRKGDYQTKPRFSGAIHGQSGIDPTLFGGSPTVFELTNGNDKKRLYAGNWLKNKRWLLIINQEAAEEMRGLFATRNMEIIIIVVGILAIVMTTIFTTRLTVGSLREAYRKMHELNAQLVQSDKIAALGKMAAGVAHEINNPLAVILQKTGWIEDLLDEEDIQQCKNIDELRASITKIEDHVERARKVVHNMLGYARKMEPRLEDVDINATLKETISLLDNYAKINNIEIILALASDLPIIASEQARLQQVFLNLINNAIDAIEKNGFIQVTSKREANFIEIKIADNGPGISEENRNKVFEPFFTTKKAGSGTGLGLWVSYDIIKKLGGEITLTNEKGKGSTFIVRVPIIKPEKK